MRVGARVLCMRVGARVCIVYACGCTCVSVLGVSNMCPCA